MQHWRTARLAADDAGIARAAELLRAGELVAFPTETVYGLGADARNGTAVAGIFEAKGRPRFNPLIVHVPDLSAAKEIGAFDDRAMALARAFWPGPLTLVVPLREDAGLNALVTAGLDSVGLRVPGAEIALRLLRAFGGPLAAPSANPSGRISPTRASHVLDDAGGGLEGRIAAVLDGGPCPVGVESTIIGMQPEPGLLRPGGVAPEEIEKVLGQSVDRTPARETVTAPGQLASHYAPVKPVRLAAQRPEPGEHWLGFGPGSDHDGLNLSVTGDLREASAALFAHLRALDLRPGRGIAVAPVPEEGLGLAINDRLRRAAAPRN